MKENITNQTVWDEAGRAGIALGLVCCVYSLIVNGMANLVDGNGVLVTTVSFFLWFVKFITCLSMMRVYMHNFASKYKSDPITTVKYGRRLGFFSALIFGAYILAEYKFIFPDAYAGQIATIMETYSSLLDSNTMSAMDGITNSLPVIVACVKFIYCYLWGWVLSLVFGIGGSSGNPFNQDEKNDQND